MNAQKRIIEVDSELLICDQLKNTTNQFLSIKNKRSHIFDSPPSQNKSKQRREFLSPPQLFSKRKIGKVSG